MRQELDISGIDTVTGFLGFYEVDILRQTTLFRDFLVLQQKFDYPEHNITLYNLVAGHLGFQVTVDRDNENAIITQRTWYRNGIDYNVVYDNLTRNSSFHPLGKAVYIGRIQKEVLITLENSNGDLHFKSDVW